MNKAQHHANLIVKQAVEAIFPLPPDPDPAHVEGILTGYAGALEAIGQPITLEPWRTVEEFTVEGFGEVMASIGAAVAPAEERQEAAA